MKDPSSSSKQHVESSVVRSLAVLVCLIAFVTLGGKPPPKHGSNSPSRSPKSPALVAETSAVTPASNLRSKRFPAPEPTLATLHSADKVLQAKIAVSYTKLPLHFEANEGQTDPKIKFLSRGAGYTLFLTDTEAVLALDHQDNVERASAELNALQRGRSVVSMKLLGANTDPRVQGLDKLPGKSNYFRGSDRVKWRTGVSQFGKVKFSNVYDGIDLVYYGSLGRLEYDFIVSPGVDPRTIQLAFNGVDEIRVDDQGDLVLNAAGEEIRFHKPHMYQNINGQKREVSGGYIISVPSAISDPGSQTVVFQVQAAYDREKPLIIDPILAFGVQVGPAWGLGIAVDDKGNSYVTGSTTSADFPITVGAFQPDFLGNHNDAFVVKLGHDGSLVYSTYIGGGDDDDAYGIAVDSQGNAYVTGETRSINFPITAGAFQPNLHGSGDVFVTKLNPDGTALVYSTYLGGRGDVFYLGESDDRGHGIAVDNLGSAYVAGVTFSGDFPTTSGCFQNTLRGSGDAFVSKLAPDGSALIYSTFIGGTGFDTALGIGIDVSGNAYVAGDTGSTDLPVTTGAFQISAKGYVDGFVAKVSSSGSALLYLTYLGGNRDDSVNAIAVDPDGNAYLTGETESLDFPTTQGAFQSQHTFSLFPQTASYIDAFVTKISADGSLLYSTFLGGQSNDQAHGIAIDSFGNAYVTGEARSGFPTTPDAFQLSPGWAQAGFVTKVNRDGSGLIFSSHLGTGSVRGSSIAVDESGNAYLTGCGSFPEFSSPPESSQTGCLFVVRISPSFQLNTTSFVVSEDSSAVTATVTRTGETEGEVTVNFTTGDATATAGSDYMSSSGSLVFAEGEMSKTITVPLLDDSMLEGDEAFQISLTNPSEAFGLGPSSATVTIHDNEVVNLEDYFPFSPGDTWTYQRIEDGASTQVTTSARKTVINGIVTQVFSNSLDGSREYYSLDADGLQLHRIITPKRMIEGLNSANTDLTFTPAIKFSDLISEVPRTFNSTGLVQINSPRTIGILPLNYSASFVLEGLYTITVPAGTYKVLRLRGSIHIAFQPSVEIVVDLAKMVGRVRWLFDRGGSIETLELTATTAGVHNLAVTKITAPKRVTLTSKVPTQRKQVTVGIQNQGPHAETIQDETMLANLVQLEVQSLGTCASPLATFHRGKPQTALPKTLQSKQKISVIFDVTFDCANNPSSGSGREDFRYHVTINSAAFGAMGDTSLPPETSTLTALTDVVMR